MVGKTRKVLRVIECFNPKLKTGNMLKDDIVKIIGEFYDDKIKNSHFSAM